MLCNSRRLAGYTQRRQDVVPGAAFLGPLEAIRGHFGKLSAFGTPATELVLEPGAPRL